MRPENHAGVIVRARVIVLNRGRHGIAVFVVHVQECVIQSAATIGVAYALHVYQVRHVCLQFNRKPVGVPIDVDFPGCLTAHLDCTRGGCAACIVIHQRHQYGVGAGSRAVEFPHLYVVNFTHLGTEIQLGVIVRSRVVIFCLGQ